MMEEEMKAVFGESFFKKEVVNVLKTLPGPPGKPKDVNHIIELPLEKLYLGTTIKIRADKKYPCKACVNAWRRQECGMCKGVGSVGPGLQCCLCHGAGFLQVPCDVCKGKGSLQEEKYFTVKVPPGTISGGKIRLRGQGDALLHQPKAASDIVCTIIEKPHPQFHRCGADLYFIQDVSLTQALCGFRAVIQHLDGRKIVLHSAAGSVIKPGDMLCAKKEGMPVKLSQDGAKGDLIVVFNVLFPSKLPAATAKTEDLEKLLPPRKKLTVSVADMEEYEIQPFDPKEQVYHVPGKSSYIEESPMKYAPKASTAVPSCAQQ